MSALAKLRQALDMLPDGALVPVEWVRAHLDGEADGADSTVEDVAAMLNRAPSTIRGWCREGRLPGAYRLRGREWRVPRESIRALRTEDSGRHTRTRRGAAPLGGWRSQVRQEGGG